MKSFLITGSLILLIWVFSIFAAWQMGKKFGFEEAMKSQTESTLTIKGSGNRRSSLDSGGISETSPKGDIGRSEISGSKSGITGSGSSSKQDRKGLESSTSSSGSSGQKQATPAQPSPWENLAETRERLENLGPGRQQSSLFQSYLTQFARLDPNGALDFALEWENYADRDRGITKVLQIWAQDDYEKAWNWAAENATSPQQYSARLTSVVRGVLSKDPDIAFTLAQSIGDASARSQAMSIISAHLLQRNGFDKVVDQLFSLEDKNARNIYISQITSHMGKNDPEKAAEWILSLESQSEVQSGVQRLADVWGQNNPNQAATWSMSLVDPNLRKQAVQRSVNRWMQYDVTAAAEWLNRQPPSPDIDLAVDSLVTRVMRDDPDGALSWAQSITDPKLKKRAVDRVNSIIQKQPGG